MLRILISYLFAHGVASAHQIRVNMTRPLHEWLETHRVPYTIVDYFPAPPVPCALFDRIRADHLPNVHRSVAIGDWETALNDWRDHVVATLRAEDFGTFGWHDAVVQSDAFQERIAVLVGDAPLGGYRDTIGLRAHMLGSARPVQWFVPLSQNELFAWGDSWKGWLGAYRRNGTRVVIDRFLALYRSVFSEMPRAWWEMYKHQHTQVRTSDYGSANTHQWNINGNHLATAAELGGFLQNLAGICKHPMPLPDVLRPNPAPWTGANLVNATLLAELVVGIDQYVIDALVSFSFAPTAAPNQRLTALQALRFFSCVFKHLRRAPALEREVETSMRSFLEEMYMPDGASLEQSVNYNADEQRVWRNLMNACPSEPTRSMMERVVERMDLALLTTPLGSPPQIGNFHPRLDRQGDTWFRPAVATAPSSSSMYPFSGYYVLRSGGDSKAKYLFFYGNRPQRGHQMHGTLSVQLYAFGRPLVVANGVPTYDPVDYMVRRNPTFFLGETSSLKLSTVVVDGKSQAWVGAELSRAPRTTTGCTFDVGSEEMEVVSGTYALGYALDGARLQLDMDVSHQRIVVFLPVVGAWIVADRMNASTPTPRTYRQIWNFAPFTTTRCRGFKPDEFMFESSRFYTADHTGPNIEFRHVGSVMYKSVYDDRVDWLGGFHGFGVGSNQVPTMNVHVEWRDASPLLTWITPTDTATPSPIQSFTGFVDRTVRGMNVRTDQREVWVRASTSAQWLEVGEVGAHGTLLVVVRRSNGHFTGVAYDATQLRRSNVVVTVTGNIWFNATSVRSLRVPTTPDLVQRTSSQIDLVVPSTHTVEVRTDETSPYVPSNGTVRVQGEGILYARAVHRDGSPDPLSSSLRYGPHEGWWRPADKPLSDPNMTSGLRFAYVTPRTHPGRILDSIFRSILVPTLTGVAPTYYHHSVQFPRPRPAQDTIVYTGYIRIAEKGVYTFGSRGVKDGCIFIHHPSSEFTRPPVYWKENPHTRSYALGLEAGFHRWLVAIRMPANSGTDLFVPTLQGEPISTNLLFYGADDSEAWFSNLG